MEDGIERIQTLYDDAIERQTDAIRRKCIIEIARLTAQMEKEINWMQCERKDAMIREMREIREQHRGDRMTEYKPTRIHRCEDPECPGYGKPKVDRGYGYPVCETQQWRSEFSGEPNLPMEAMWLEGE